METDIEDLTARAARHVARATGLDAAPGLAVDSRTLMRFLTGAYAFSTIVIDGVPHLAFSSQAGFVRATALSKHAEILSDRLGFPAIYLVGGLTRPGLHKLVDALVPFIVPGRHLHIPGKVVEIGNRFEHVVDELMQTLIPGSLGPTAQAMLIRRVLGLDDGRIPSMGLAAALRVTSQTALNAAKELVKAELAVVGRQRHTGSLEFTADGRRLFELALPLLQSPVILTQHYCGSGSIKGCQLGGETALARMTSLVEPSVPVYVTARRARRGIGHRSNLERCLSVDADISVEVWRYDPETMSRGEIIDPLSLYLKFRDHPDERVATAAGELLDKALK